jgi:hypothetical protein
MVEELSEGNFSFVMEGDSVKQFPKGF